MKTNIYIVEHGVQIRIDVEDTEMKLHDALNRYLRKRQDVEFINSSVTFETPITDFKYNNILFSVLFDEMTDETFAFVSEEYDYKIIEKLLQECDINY